MSLNEFITFIAPGLVSTEKHGDHDQSEHAGGNHAADAAPVKRMGAERVGKLIGEFDLTKVSPALRSKIQSGLEDVKRQLDAAESPEAVAEAKKKADAEKKPGGGSGGKKEDEGAKGGSLERIRAKVQGLLGEVKLAQGRPGKASSDQYAADQLSEMYLALAAKNPK